MFIVAFIIVATIAATLVVVVIALNLKSGRKRITHAIEHQYDVGQQDFINTVGHLLGPPLVDGNTITVLKNGIEIFPAMLQAIGNAQHTICFETYIYWSGELGRKFASALAERAQAGVLVHVTLDFVGSFKMNQSLIEEMEKAGVQVVRYHPIRWYTITRFNNRTHRKLLIVDGIIGFTGGVGIADRWLGNADSPDHWRDTQVEVRGPVVADLQSVFMDNWLKTKSVVLHGPKYFPPKETAGEVVAQVFKSSPDGGSESASLLFQLSITSARHSILIGASYFVPDDISLEHICLARKRGVAVKILVPGELIDAPWLRALSRSLWKPLLTCGVQIFEYQPTMFHTKMMIVDGIWTSIGSTNFDNRSFRLNDEANLNALDRELATLLTSHFDSDLEVSKEVTLADWKKRSYVERLKATLVRPFQSQL